jgi:hypothetical protein
MKPIDRSMAAQSPAGSPGLQQRGLPTLFDVCVQQIEQNYRALGHTLGWRFLTGPKATLSAGTQIALITLNPGGSAIPPDHPPASRETGSAYVEETWGSYAPGDAPLQRQVQGLCRTIQGALNDSSPLASFMSQRLLSAHFIPFRSPTLAALPQRQASLRFAHALWSSVLAYWTPRLIITIDRETFESLREPIESKQRRELTEQREWPSGWGSYLCQSIRYTDGVTIARLPHLSRFELFNRAASARQMQNFISYLCG